MLRWMAPFLSFTAEEAWKVFAPGTSVSIFTETYCRHRRLGRRGAARQVGAHPRDPRRGQQGDRGGAQRRRRWARRCRPTLTITAPPADHALLASLGDDLKFVIITSAVALREGEALAIEVTAVQRHQVRALLALARRCRRRPGAPDDLRPLRQQPVRRGRTPHGRLSMAGRSSSGAPGLWLWLGLALLVVLLDQLSKTLVIGAFELNHSQPLTSLFNLVRVHNSGAAFSFLAGASGWQRWFFVGLGTLASGFIVWMLKKHPTQKLFCFAVTMIMGGAIGNVIDRLLHGYVVDFIQWHYGGWYFPAFNLADSAITLGAICLILDEILRVRRGRLTASGAARMDDPPARSSAPSNHHRVAKRRSRSNPATARRANRRPRRLGLLHREPHRKPGRARRQAADRAATAWALPTRCAGSPRAGATSSAAPASACSTAAASWSWAGR